MTKLYPVIMAGGVGSRLWPLSRELYPKQLLNLVSPTQTLLQGTLERLKGLKVECGQPWVICNRDHRFLVAEQLRTFDLGPERILLEPVGRNTAPAIALGAFEILQEDPNGSMLVLAADHDIRLPEVFRKAIESGMAAVDKGFLLTFGIKPSYPETGYGYIKRGTDLALGSDDFPAARVQAFTEKPDFNTAQAFLASGEYSWNSGIFLMKAADYLAELKRFEPEIYRCCEEAVSKAQRSYGFVQVDEASFSQCPGESVDYAVMEKTDKAAVIAMDAGWSDVGSWNALWELGEKDALGNVLVGDVRAIESTQNYVRTDKRLIAAVGVSDLLIVDTADALLVAHKDKAQHIKNIVNELKSESRSEVEVHTRDYRPWGNYETIDESDRFKVKRIVVQPGAKLSLQMHHHRAEHWIVVKGTAAVIRGEEAFLLSENESTFIPLGEKHQLSNPGKIPLEMIEVQSGPYLGEDDIQRFEDAYGRT